jgi:glyoxylate carboligase
MNGAAAVLKALEKQGVTTVFGHPGGAIMPIYDALYDSPIQHVLVRHEQAGAHAADAYYRASGRVGVCFATSGPGATNLVTGLATAYMDSSAVVAITGNVPLRSSAPTRSRRPTSPGITLPVTKHNYLVKDVATSPASSPRRSTSPARPPRAGARRRPQGHPAGRLRRFVRRRDRPARLPPDGRRQRAPDPPRRRSDPRRPSGRS